MSRENYNYINQVTEKSLLRIPFMWEAFRALHNSNLYLCNLWLNRGYTYK